MVLDISHVDVFDMLSKKLMFGIGRVVALLLPPASPYFLC